MDREEAGQGGGAPRISRRSRRRSTRWRPSASPERVFGFWDWVGGRYSIWSAIGLPMMIAIGPGISRFLAGAHAMDGHFKAADAASNLPVLLGLVGIWHRVICGYPARAVIPYDQRLSRCRPICSSSTWNPTARA